MTALVGRYAATYDISDARQSVQTQREFLMSAVTGIFLPRQGEFDDPSFHHERKVRAIHGQPASKLVIHGQGSTRRSKCRT
jgi:hypothetical protein